MSDFEHLVNQVLAIDGSKSKSDILADLQYTKSVEITVNRIFDGEVKPLLSSHFDKNLTSEILHS